MVGKFDWYDYVEGSILSTIKTYIENEYPAEEVFFTTDDVNLAETSLPCIYVYCSNSVESASTIRNDTIGLVNYSIQIKIYAKDKTLTNNLMRSVVYVLKHSMRFRGNPLPLMTVETDLYLKTATFRRLIAEGDNLILGGI